MNKVFHSRAEIARHRGVSAATVSAWISAGLLPPEGPWSIEQAAAPTIERPSMTSAHGTASAYRYGCRCEICSRAHAERTEAARAEQAAEFWRERETTLLDLLADGTSYRDALAAVGVSSQKVAAHRRRSERFAIRLDAALLAGRDPDLDHGRYTAWRAGCRCPECSAAHEATR